MNMKMVLGFLAGAVFVLGLLVTCGTGSKSGGTRTASAGGGTAWEYAQYDYMRAAFEGPTTATQPNLTSCQTTVCVLNAMGADGWELVAYGSPIFYFKRAK
jgi:hypothetical protein